MKYEQKLVLESLKDKLQRLQEEQTKVEQEIKALEEKIRRHERIEEETKRYKG